MTEADPGGNGAVTSPTTDGGRCIEVPLGRRVEVIGDLMLPPEPTASSLASCRDVARRLGEWQGPGTVVICGQLAAPGGHDETASEAFGHHPGLGDAFAAFAARPDSRVIVVVPPGSDDTELVEALTSRGVSVRDAVDLRCETGAGTRTVLVRAGSPRSVGPPGPEVPPGEDRPWLVGLERLDDPPRARRFVTSRLLYRRLRRYLWAPPLVLAAVALLLRIEFVVDGLGRLFRSPRQQEALQRAYGASWFDRFVVTLVIAALLVAVLAVVVAVTSRGIWRALGGEGLPRPWAGGTSGTRPVAHSLLTIDGHDALDAARQAVAAGAAGVVVGGALVPELTHLQGGFFACPGATSEVVREHRGRLGLPPRSCTTARSRPSSWRPERTCTCG